MFGSLVMGIAGVSASVLSNSSALLVDGLFSLVGFCAAIVAIRVGRQASAAADDDRPFGYSADEAVFTTFRSLSLLGLVVFAFAGAVTKIAAYIGGTVPIAVKYEVIGIYVVAISLICLGLWANYRRAWKNSGEQSDILMLEARAAAFDGSITATAGVGFGLVYLLQNGPLAFVAPIGDSIIVLFLCLFAAATYWSDFKNSLGELVGVSAAPKIIQKVRATVQEKFSNENVDVIDIVVSKSGRLHFVAVFVNPFAPILAADVDRLSLLLEENLKAQFSRVEVLVIISESGRGPLSKEKTG